MAIVTIFYKDDIDCKNTDVMYMDNSPAHAIGDKIERGDKVIVILPGVASCYVKTKNRGADKYAMRIIDYTQYIMVDSIAKVIIEDA